MVGSRVTEEPAGAYGQVLASLAVVAHMAELNNNGADGRRPVDSLREAETWFQPLIESLGDDALFFLDAEGRVMSWNAGVRRDDSESSPIA